MDVLEILIETREISRRGVAFGPLHLVFGVKPLHLVMLQSRNIVPVKL